MKIVAFSLYRVLKRGHYIIPIICCCWMGCDHNSKSRFTVVATTGFIGDAARNIVQEHAEVITLMGAGVDPHAYKATQQDVKYLLNADIIFYNGFHLEGKMADILHKLSKKKTSVCSR